MGEPGASVPSSGSGKAGAAQREPGNSWSAGAGSGCRYRPRRAGGCMGGTVSVAAGRLRAAQEGWSRPGMRQRKLRSVYTPGLN